MYFTPARSVHVRRATCAPTWHASDRVLDKALTALRPTTITGRAEVKADTAGWTLSLDMPGVSKEQLNIDIEGHTVRIRSLEDAPRQYHRVMELPQEIDAALSTARLENGVLTLSLAKKLPGDTNTRITIN